MKTKWMMSASAILMAALGLTATFLPQETAAALGGDTAGTTVLMLQVTGGLYLGFAILHWFARAAAIGARSFSLRCTSCALSSRTGRVARCTTHTTTSAITATSAAWRHSVSISIWRASVWRSSRVSAT